MTQHLSVRTTSLPREVTMVFTCKYKMGDDFVDHVNEVDCSTCLDQIRAAFAIVERSPLDADLIVEGAEIKAVRWLRAWDFIDELPPEESSKIVASLADLLQGREG